MPNGEIELVNGHRLAFTYEIIRGRYIQGKVIGLPWSAAPETSFKAIYGEDGNQLRLKTVNFSLRQSEGEGPRSGEGSLEGELA